MGFAGIRMSDKQNPHIGQIFGQYQPRYKLDILSFVPLIGSVHEMKSRLSIYLTFYVHQSIFAAYVQIQYTQKLTI